jgi:prefoldin subunit 5
MFILLFRVENDVKLLRNRVRMLQMEHDRAQKKINETQNKAETLERLKHENN